MTLLLDLFLTFAKVGLFTFGGGYAMLSIIENACVEQKRWITHDDMMNVTVIAESTPGPISINCATFVGYRQKGVAGSVAATLGLVSPSFVIIYFISLFLDNFLEIAWVVYAFSGIKLAVGILILDAGITMMKKMKTSNKPLSYTILACSLTATLCINIFKWKLSSVSLMLLAAVVGIVTFQIQTALEKKGGEAT